MNDEPKSICYGCAYYDWAIVFAQTGHAWEHVCYSEAKYIPGDDVSACEGFKELKK